MDEGNNWINMTWGPRSLTNPVSGSLLGNYALAAGSPAMDHIPSTAPTYALAPATDFFGNPRPDCGGVKAIDVGAVEFQVAVACTPTLTSISPTSGACGTSFPVTLTGTNLTGAMAVTVSGNALTVGGITGVNSTTVTAPFTIAAHAKPLSPRNVSVTTPGGTSNNLTFTVTGPTLTSIAPTSATHPTSGSINVPVVLAGTNLTGAAGLNGLTGGVSPVGGTLSVVNSTTIDATLNITSGATIGNRSISVATPNADGGATNTVTFRVN